VDVKDVMKRVQEKNPSLSLLSIIDPVLTVAESSPDKDVLVGSDAEEKRRAETLHKRRVRIVGVMKAWFEEYFADFGADPLFMAILAVFLEVRWSVWASPCCENRRKKETR
jgi:hypothetical protein